MRDPNRIDKLTRLLKRVWRKYPDVRLKQLLDFIFYHKSEKGENIDMIHTEDEEWILMLEKELSEEKEKKNELDLIRDNNALTLTEFMAIMDVIERKHGFYHFGSGKNIKYIRPNIDTRDGKIFNITFDDKEFDSRQGVRMYTEIMEWLEGDKG